MTSRSLFFKLMKEDIKRKIWAVGLSFLMFFFWMPVAAAMSISSLKQNLERWLALGISFGEGITAQMEYQSRLLNLVPEVLGMGNIPAAMTVGTAAIVLALTGFMYLHSKKQMDFYHSIPVRREVIFAVKYIDGFLILLSMYLLNMLFGIAIFAVNGIGFSATVSPALITMLVHMAGFLLIYGVMTVAVVLTGNFFISILGGIVLFSYIPAFVELIDGLMCLFFVTVNMRELPLSDWKVHGSPIAYYVFLWSDGYSMEPAKYGTLAGRAGLALAAALVIALVAMVLYKRRPSESAGKAMAFQLTKAPIKILLVVPVTIFTALLFWNVYYSLLWAIFGFLLGLVITHGMIEIIYHFEFRKIFANPVHMGICAALALAVIGIFRYDVIGYDRYLPKESEFQSASIYGYGMKDWNNYGLPVKNSTGYSWNYMESSNYAVENMEITDYGLISAVAGAGIENAGVSRENMIFNRWDSDGDKDGYWVSLEVGYRLKNGKKVYRNYNIDIQSIRDVFEEIYVSPEYKKGVYPVLSYYADNLAGVYEARDGRIQKADMDFQAMEEILAAYQEELTALTLEERSRETPVTSIRFLTLAEYEYLKYISSSRNPNFSGDFRMEDMNQVNFFPIYPSFTKTLELLEKAGIDLSGPDADDVESIEISCGYEPDGYLDTEELRWNDTVYTWTYNEEEGRTVIRIVNDGSEESMEKIKEILNSVEIADMAELNRLQPFDRSFSVQVLLKNEKNFRNYLFRCQEVPEFVRAATGYDSEDVFWKAVNYGLEGSQAK